LLSRGERGKKRAYHKSKCNKASISIDSGHQEDRERKRQRCIHKKKKRRKRKR